MLLNSKELRIGNRILIATMFGKNIHIVNGKDINALSYIRFKNITLQGIELTPQILLACGFTLTFEKALTWEFYELKEFAFYYYCITQKSELAYNGQLLKHIKYLHQLQNLFFILMNKELEISLPLISSS